MLEKTGLPTSEDLAKVTPSKERLSRGPVAIIECFQRIPCNPCYTACKRGAIKEFKDINDLPEIDFELCNGCALCVSKCPGLAIFVIDQTFSEKEALVKIPYEFLPVPEKGEVVDALDRKGERVSKARVVKVTKFRDNTHVISVAVPKELSMEVRNIKLQRDRYEH